MELRWTEDAANDLEHIASYLLSHVPSRAHDLVGALYDAHRTTETPESRGDVIFVVRILHGARKWL